MAQANRNDEAPFVSRYARKKALEARGEKKPFEFVDGKVKRGVPIAPPSMRCGRVRVMVERVATFAFFRFLELEGWTLYLSNRILEGLPDVEIVPGCTIDCEVLPAKAGKNPQVTCIYEVTPRV